ncbi:PulJ/GspJ family protein [Bordetella bronchialis]|uniref:PulJ/GspJ family protein n=1 Tax=Bordetella bronchialis TaxID=463025 RepID=UPI000B0A2FDC|nr:prepilin-type N-terminal cleavage/methylation domain-containing protein [Bordetella bronchialis]
MKSKFRQAPRTAPRKAPDRPSAATRSGQRGFTLIEVLVAIALLAIVSVLAWRGLDSVVRTRDHVRRDAERDDALIRVLGQLQRDMQMRAPDTVLDGGTAQAVVRRILPAALRVDPARGGAQLDIVRTAAPDGRWQHVRWWRDGDALRRAAGPGAQAFPLPEAGPGADVLDGVLDFAVQAWIPGRGWIALPDNGDGEAATGLAFVLRLAAPVGSQALVYRRVVALP